ncbi:MAG: hypothetical protein JJT94_02555 [Bernardetiaceae bacterium]|nr:hypothetical protein [Bernardetiaceae bacterium]
MSEEKSSGLPAFIKRVQDGVVNLTTLEIKTIVGDFDVNAKDDITPRANTDFKVMSSRINLIAGDVTAYISNDMLEDSHEWVRNFHAHKEEKGHEIINANIQTIISLIELYKRSQKE